MLEGKKGEGKQACRTHEGGMVWKKEKKQGGA